MDEHKLDTLFRAAIREIHKGWRSRQSLSSFVNFGESALRRIRSEYNHQQATATATIAAEKLNAVANVRQLTFITNLCRTTIPRFNGYMVQISYQGGVYGEIFIGPKDTFDSIMWLPPYGEYLHRQDNPYTKSRRRMWKKIEDFEFDAVVTALKERINKPLVYDDNDEDEMPF